MVLTTAPVHLWIGIASAEGMKKQCNYSAFSTYIRAHASSNKPILKTYLKPLDVWTRRMGTKSRRVYGIIKEQLHDVYISRSAARSR